MNETIPEFISNRLFANVFEELTECAPGEGILRATSVVDPIVEDVSAGYEAVVQSLLLECLQLAHGEVQEESYVLPLRCHKLRDLKPLVLPSFPHPLEED